jgi:2-polyprenyl-3-methyl-5-hydroxy-6-metoxy-1,4-benzoquinol methylase
MAFTNLARAEHTARNRGFYDLQALDPAAEEAFAADQKTKVARIAELLRGLTPRAQVAEVGAFSGYAAIVYSRVPGVKTVTCFDVSPEAVGRCRERGFPAELWNADADACPASDASFDVVLAPDVIEHLVNTEEFLLELRRICRPQGYLILSTPNLAFWLNRLRLLLGRAPWCYPGVSHRTKRDSAIDLNHVRINLHSEWTHLLDSCGWRVERLATYSLLDDQPRSVKNIILYAADRLLRLLPGLAFGHIYLARWWPNSHDCRSCSSEGP